MGVMQFFVRGVELLNYDLVENRCLSHELSVCVSAVEVPSQPEKMQFIIFQNGKPCPEHSYITLDTITAVIIENTSRKEVIC